MYFELILGTKLKVILGFEGFNNGLEMYFLMKGFAWTSLSEPNELA